MAQQKEDVQTLERVTVNLTPRSHRALTELMESVGLSKTDIINRALQLYADLQRALDGDGAVYVREGSQGELERIRFY
jgi:hypothetical protein